MSDLKERLNALSNKGLEQINQVDDLKKLNAIKVELLGKKGPITEILRDMKNLTPDERPKIGAFANDVKTKIAEAVSQRIEQLQEVELNHQLAHETLDVTLPGTPVQHGTSHILTTMISDLEDFFIGLGYQVIDGPEVEEDHYNFEMMNIPADHPARDMQDTFYITSDILMRTHTSPVQARTLEKHDFSQGPLKMISPGRVFRRDTDDATHSHQFHQVEGLVIDRHITMADLKGTLEAVVKHVFGQNRQIRLRPSYFPFTEPSVEVDVSCFACGGQGCKVCKQTGWIEVLGAGMVHPNVLTNAGVDATQFGGFAFGLGVDRFAMLKYGVSDIREFYQNDLRFLHQFRQEEVD